MPSIAIIGGGISGLSSAWYINQALPDCQITLYESEKRLGGKIQSTRQDGFLFEHGPNGFMDSRQEIVDLCQALGLDDQIVKSNDASAERFILKDNKLRRLPKKPQQIFTTAFLPIKAKLRLLLEPFIKKITKEDETLYEFAHRRLGRYFAEYIIDPFTSGVFGSDCRKISVRSAFPTLREMELKHGSLFKAVKAKLKDSPKKQGKLSSFDEGMEVLIKALHKQLEGKVTFIHGQPVTKVSESKDSCTVYSKENEQNHENNYDIVITACPAGPTATILKEELGNKLAENVESIPYSAISVVAQGFKSPKPDNINAFGYLIPSSEPSKVLGVLFSSCIFPGRAPQNQFSLRAMVGGGKVDDITKSSDDEILELILAENQQTLGISKQADTHTVINWHEAIPRYDLGHWKIISELEDVLENKAIFITGNAFYGVSMNECITASANLAKKVKDHLENN